MSAMPPAKATAAGAPAAKAATMEEVAVTDAPERIRARLAAAVVDGFITVNAKDTIRKVLPVETV